ncbi:MAG: hypothetical protein A3I24_01100 [Candidatus Harrisonbacteria bacterium RIFCSPLOWO2_02_FULL_41_13b]|uniref:ParB-like N-terminal domain-containing protein n=1 Tax=Candidatus Harrisonbacteria bacterium RIFCSPLOWO2_02_FULL_41_13b TaxID=1798409 RepID=A0A1G1ZRB4_9BACT|nr:MAG: hypothetical protein A3J53_03030 [Candidatus Harrisonbacteria bacterium RIFCSPHIGHO2_02_FULL_40_20]OGY67258.1 MAG: hypothetical protein A3I24_01100 [Candidatus Harrisonbacteria bacterium RIFCSPLOWO2_02_FULL_41_13b]
MDNPPIQGPIFLIETNKISPNPHQPRRDFDETALRELANSIREFGILQPLIVTKLEKENETGTSVEYQLIAGERRWRASALLGLERVPAIIRNTNLEKDRLELAIIENVQRENLNPIEMARAYSKLQDDYNLTQREIATRLGKSREAVANTIRLLNLPTPIQESISKNQISESQGRLLLSVPDLIQQQSLFDDLLKNNMSVRELKSRITKLNKPAEPELTQPAPTNNPENLFLQKQLEELLGTKVKVEKSGDSGKITIAFYSQEELQSLIQKLSSTGGENQPL